MPTFDEELCGRLAQLYPKAAYDQMLREAERGWPELSPFVSPAGAESCRLTMLACFGAHRYPCAYVWRARALSRAGMAGYRNGLAALTLQEAVRLTVTVPTTHKDFPDFADAALGILDEMKLLIDPDAPPVVYGPTADDLLGLFHEKRGLIHWFLGRYGQAADEYESGLQHTHGETQRRRNFKIDLGLTLCRYMADRSPGNAVVCAKKTRQSGAECRSRGFDDLADMVERNVEPMMAGSTDVHPYELL
jgi:hypothetical protein